MMRDAGCERKRGRPAFFHLPRLSEPTTFTNRSPRTTSTIRKTRSAGATRGSEVNELRLRYSTLRGEDNFDGEI